MQAQINPFTPNNSLPIFSQTKLTSHVLVVAMMLCTWLLIGGVAQAQSLNETNGTDTGVTNVVNQREAYGLIKNMATDSLVGHWTIGKYTYLVNYHTQVSDGGAAYEIGDCVVVKYYGHASVRVARQIAAAEADLCADSNESNSQGGTDSTQSETGELDDEMPQEIAMHKGLIKTMPLSSLFGGWSVDAIKFITNVDTDFVQIDGSLLDGACVTVYYSGDRMPYTIVKIVAEEPDACMETGTVEMPPSGPTYKDYGRIEALPDNTELLGEWTVNGVNYLVTNSTRVAKWHGQFTAGTCIKIWYQAGELPFEAEKIRTARQHHCGGQDDEQGFARGVLFGQIREFPTELIGDWNVGGMSFAASDSTTFEQRRGDFAEGVTVKVKFYVDEEGVNQATKVKTLFKLWSDEKPNPADPDDDSGYTGVAGHAFGQIDSFPVGLVGDWTVGGIDYIANADTIFRQNAADFAEDVAVRIRYYVDEAGHRVATQIKSVGGTTTIPGRQKICGYVGKLPAYGFNGDWLVDGINLLAEESAEFEEKAALLGLGSYAEIEYGKRNGRYVIYKVKAHVPPGAGDNNLIGTLRRIESFALTSADVSAQSGPAQADNPAQSGPAQADNETWEIGGQTYIVTPATDLDEQDGELFVGSTVAVNSYTDADGNEVATKINVVTNSPASFLDNDLYLPLFDR